MPKVQWHTPPWEAFFGACTAVLSILIPLLAMGAPGLLCWVDCASLWALISAVAEMRGAVRQQGSSSTLEVRTHEASPSVFYHGTTMSRARLIQKQGFISSKSGCLGAGVYVVEKKDINKAKRFAHDRAAAAHDEPALIVVTATIRNPKRDVPNNDQNWQAEGYDSCSALRTSASKNPEWCVRDPSQIHVQQVWSLQGEPRPTN
mmetsp:Transcript_37073/g.69138  ORF Transcript_37073/g.69138 Transcript_37073/m.69138 type:complete len:204 (-) Transcript_37073:125-736(-)